MDTYGPGEIIRNRASNQVGRALWLASWITPAPIWISESDRWGTSWHWYGLGITYPRRISFGQLETLPPGLRRWIGFADDALDSRNPLQFGQAVTRFALDTYGHGTAVGGVIVAPSFYGSDP